MSKVKCDVAGLQLNIQQFGERAVRGIADVMREEGKEIETLAKSYAPVDEGYLEEAIEYDESRSGVNKRLVVKVGVDLNAPGSHGRSISAYAMTMHEQLAPYGSGVYKLGKRSEAKAAAGNKVGGKYMERAVLARVGMLGKKVAAVIRRLTGG